MSRRLSAATPPASMPQASDPPFPFLGPSLFSVGIFSLTPEGPGSHPQMTQISTDVFLGSTHLLNLRNLRIPEALIH